MRVSIVDVSTLARNWWLILLRGVAGVSFGMLTFVVPRLSVAALVLVFGAYALADGVLTLFSAARNRASRDWWMLVVEGIAGVSAGVLTFLWPGITAVALLYLIAAWALVTGSLELIAAMRLRRVIRGEWLLVLNGMLSVALGALLGLFPGPGAVALVIWIGAYALVSGVLLMVLGARLRLLRHGGGRTLDFPPDSVAPSHG